MVRIEIAMNATAVSADDDASSLLNRPLSAMLVEAKALTLAAHGPLVTYSRKVFIPLTKLCRDVCHYCTFATTPARRSARPTSA